MLTSEKNITLSPSLLFVLFQDFLWYFYQFIFACVLEHLSPSLTQYYLPHLTFLN